YNSATQQLDEAALSNLYSKIAGKDNATIADVKNLLTASNNYQYSSSDIRTNNTVTEGNDIYVYFGGLRWTVTYVSKAKTGNVVATLWLDSSKINGLNQTAQFSTWNNSNAYFSNTYLPSVYGTSYIRSYLNGTPYYTNNSGTMNMDGSPNAYWQTFRDTYGKFIIEPLYMGWQETESLVRGGIAYYFCNDAWGYGSADAWYNATSSTMNNELATKKVGYSAWATDKLWLPSLAETGGVAGASTFSSWWSVSQAQCQNGTSTSASLDTYSTWTRTIDGGSAQGCAIVFGEGSKITGSVVTELRSVRPCIHLNISGENPDLWDSEQLITNQFEVDTLIEGLTSAASNQATKSSIYKDLEA
ncbi:MAG: hypothetical protein K2O54_02215, partial [Prevotella sp.]|nr:hypothetical protein [Prevotella sp.]